MSKDKSEEKPEDMLDKVEYLGDGLYAKWDGFQIYLLANSENEPTDVVVLDRHTLESFIAYIKKFAKGVV